MERETNFFLASSQTHSSLLVTWGNWDNSVAVRSVGFESASVRLHHHPLNKVKCLSVCLSVDLSVCLSVHLSVDLSVCPSVCLLTCLSVCLFV